MNLRTRPGLRSGLSLAALALVAPLVLGCSAGTASAPASASGGTGSIAVLGAENFYADLLTHVGGDRVTATSILNDPNADPHAFESSPQTAAAVADARVVIVNGLGYDAFMDKLLAAAPDPTRVVINVQQLLGLPDDANAHVWYHPGTMPAVAHAVAGALSELDPASAADYATREQAYLATLAPLTARIASLKSSIGGLPVAFTEPVAGYLTTALGLRVLTPEGFQKAVEDGTDPAPADVATERDLLTGHQVKALLYNSQVVTPLTQQIHDLAVSSGIPVVGVAETMPPGSGSFAAWQLGQLDKLARALGGGQ